MVPKPIKRLFVLFYCSIAVENVYAYTVFFDELDLPPRNFQTFDFVDTAPDTCYQATTTYPIPDITAVGVINGREAGNFGSLSRAVQVDNLRALALYNGTSNFECIGPPDVIIRFHDVDHQNTLQMVDLGDMVPSVAGKYLFWKPINPDDEDWVPYMLPEDGTGYVAIVDGAEEALELVYAKEDTSPAMSLERFETYDQARAALRARNGRGDPVMDQMRQRLHWSDNPYIDRPSQLPPPEGNTIGDDLIREIAAYDPDEYDPLDYEGQFLQPKATPSEDWNDIEFTDSEVSNYYWDADRQLWLTRGFLDLGQLGISIEEEPLKPDEPVGRPVGSLDEIDEYVDPVYNSVGVPDAQFPKTVGEEGWEIDWDLDIDAVSELTPPELQVRPGTTVDNRKLSEQEAAVRVGDWEPDLASPIWREADEANNQPVPDQPSMDEWASGSFENSDEIPHVSPVAEQELPVEPLDLLPISPLAIGTPAMSTTDPEEPEIEVEESWSPQSGQVRGAPGEDHPAADIFSLGELADASVQANLDEVVDGDDDAFRADRNEAPVARPQRMRIRPSEDYFREPPHVLPFYIPRPRRPEQYAVRRRPVGDVVQRLQSMRNPNLNSIESYLTSITGRIPEIDEAMVELMNEMSENMEYESPEWQDVLDRLRNSRDDLQRRVLRHNLFAPYSNLGFDDQSAQSLVELGMLYKTLQEQELELEEVLLNLDLDNVQVMDEAVARQLSPDQVRDLPAGLLLSYYLALDPDRLEQLRSRQQARREQERVGRGI
ncbi:hypothetical protein AA313_de0200882 [Arthrobotrys entomopaga]|nr:hypothetical protein AA313_de0200882 [Arthrobotrys entomopaga]